MREPFHGLNKFKVSLHKPIRHRLLSAQSLQFFRSVTKHGTKMLIFLAANWKMSDGEFTAQ